MRSRRSTFAIFVNATDMSSWPRPKTKTGPDGYLFAVGPALSAVVMIYAKVPAVNAMTPM